MESPEHMSSNNTISRFERGTPASLKNSVIALLCIVDFRMGDIAIQLGNLTAMGVRV